ncbi:MAG: BglG family transcription antiterminator [Chloroflexota bacterium]
MVITLNTRSRNVLMMLLQTSKPLASAEIASTLNLTPRIIRYTTNEIKKWLEERNIVLISRPGYGMEIIVPSGVRADLLRELENLTGYPLELSQTERMQTVVLTLLTTNQPVPVSEFEQQLGVSRTIVLKDIKKAELWLVEYDLTLLRRPRLGFQIAGSLLNWRTALEAFFFETLGEAGLSSITNGNTNNLRNYLQGRVSLARKVTSFLDDPTLSLVDGMVQKAEARLHLQFTDRSYSLLVIRLVILIQQLRLGVTISLSPEQLGELKQLKEYSVAEELGVIIEQTLKIKFPDTEAAYITMQLLGARTRKPFSNSTVHSEPIDNDEEVQEVVGYLLEIAATYLHPYLKVDQQLIRNLTYDIKPAIFRLRYNLILGNPRLEDVKGRFPYIFKVAQKGCIQMGERFGREVSENEIGYIAMHLIAAMERLRPQNSKHFKVLVVCGEGLATAWMLVSRLQVDLPEIEVLEVMSLNEVKKQLKLDSEIDGMISTIPLEIPGVPIIVVNPMLDIEDIANIRRVFRSSVFFNRVTGNKTNAERPSLASLLTPEMIRLKIIASTWQEVVIRAGEILLDLDRIDIKYIYAMQEVIQQNGPYVVIVPGVALLHARPEQGVHHLCMSLITLKTSVYFGHPKHDPVDIAIVLGAIDDHTHLRALLELVEILRDQDVIGKIRCADAKLDVCDLIHNFSFQERNE